MSLPAIIWEVFLNLVSYTNPMKNLFLSIIAVLTVSSCTTLSNVSKIGSKQVSITNTQWTLAETVKGKTPTLIIENNKLSGNAGCNNYFGTLMLDTTAGNFSASGIGATKMACENMETENNFLSMLQEANKYVVSGNTLELYKNNLLLMKLNKL